MTWLSSRVAQAGALERRSSGPVYSSMRVSEAHRRLSNGLLSTSPGVGP
jgi:hypothetical protein